LDLMRVCAGTGFGLALQKDGWRCDAEFHTQRHSYVAFCMAACPGTALLGGRRSCCGVPPAA
jgi:hypothetical protein